MAMQTGEAVDITDDDDDDDDDEDEDQIMIFMIQCWQLRNKVKTVPVILLRLKYQSYCLYSIVVTDCI